MKTLIIFLLLTSTCFAGQVESDGVKYTYSDMYSFKDMTGKGNVDIPNGTVVYASCYSQETPNKEIFRPSMSGVTFLRCNLDNVKIPAGNQAIQCSQRKFKVQNDREDWILDAQNKPVEPINKDKLLSEGKNVDPKRIPATMVAAQ